MPKHYSSFCFVYESGNRVFILYSTYCLLQHNSRHLVVWTFGDTVLDTENDACVSCFIVLKLEEKKTR